MSCKHAAGLHFQFVILIYITSVIHSVLQSIKSLQYCQASRILYLLFLSRSFHKQKKYFQSGHHKSSRTRKLDLSTEIWLECISDIHVFAKYSLWLSWCFGPHLCRGKGLYLTQGWGLAVYYLIPPIDIPGHSWLLSHV